MPSVSGPSSPIVVTGLASGQYTVSVTATNAAGLTGPASTPQTVTVGTANAPGTPTGVSATVTGTSAVVSFTPGGGGVATSFTVTSNTGGYSATGTASPITVTGLAAGTYTFTVTATNAGGTSSSSTASNSVTVAGGAVSPYVRQLATGTVTSTQTTITSGSTGSTVPAGNNVILAVVTNGPVSSASASDSAGGTFTLNVEAVNGTQLTVLIFSRRQVAQLPSGSTFTVDLGNSRALSILRAYEMTSFQSSGALDQTAVATNPASGIPMTTQATSTTSAASELAFAVFGVSSGATTDMTFTPGPGWAAAGTAGTAHSGTSGRELFCEYRVLTATGAVTATATPSVAKSYTGAVATYRLV